MSDDSSDGPGNAVGEFWTDLLDDAAAIAAEYREEGWEVRTVEPGDVTPIDDADHDRFGLSVLVPGSEYDALEELVERDGISFDAAEVYRRSVGGTAFAIAVERDEASEAAVVVPLYYSSGEASAVLETALERGELRIHLRPLSIENWVTFEHDEPALFVPEDGGPDDAPSDEAADDPSVEGPSANDRE